MKTTLDLDDRTSCRSKDLGCEARTSLKRLVEEDLKLRLRAQQAPVEPALPRFHGFGGLVRGLTGLGNKAS